MALPWAEREVPPAGRQIAKLPENSYTWYHTLRPPYAMVASATGNGPRGGTSPRSTRVRSEVGVGESPTAQGARPLVEAPPDERFESAETRRGLRGKVDAALKGDEEHAPNIRLGQPAQSPLLRFVKSEGPDLLMPPKGDRLTPEQNALPGRWIQEGATQNSKTN
jgi:hypothetical protein